MHNSLLLLNLNLLRFFTLLRRCPIRYFQNEYPVFHRRNDVFGLELDGHAATNGLNNKRTRTFVFSGTTTVR